MVHSENTIQDLIGEIDDLLSESPFLANYSSSVPSVDIDSHNTHPHPPTSPRQKATVEDLISDIDTYLASQAAYSTRRNSNGTMFVDYDGSGPPVVSWRHQPVPEPLHWPSRSPPTLHDPDMQVVRHSQDSEGGMYIRGHDPETRFDYAYDGRVLHVHRKNPSYGSEYSEYYDVDARDVERDKPLRVGGEGVTAYTDGKEEEG